MIIRHRLPYKSFTKIDRYVFADRDLSDGAKVLYGYMCGLRNGANFSDKYIQAALDLSQPVLARRKRELTKAGLIMVEQISARIYVIYIGFKGYPAEQVKTDWEKEEDKYNEK